MDAEKQTDISDLVDLLRKNAEAVRHRLEDGSVPESKKYASVDLLQKRLNQIRTALLTTLYGVDPHSSGQVFVTHYTGLQTVRGILTAAAAGNGDEAVLRRYSSSRFNDPEDGLLLLKHVCASSTPPWLTPADPRPAYVASFILPGDDENTPVNTPSDRLKYWRFYGANGTGCSIRVPVPRDRLHRVLYGEQSLEKTTTYLSGTCTALRAVLDPHLRISQEYRCRIQNTVKESVQGLFATVRFLHKNAAYRDENECRVLDSADDNAATIRFSVENADDSGVDVRPFRTDPDLHARNIFATGSTITIGPCVAHKEDVRAYFEYLLGKANLSGPTVNISKVRYRVS